MNFIRLKCQIDSMTKYCKKLQALFLNNPKASFIKSKNENKEDKNDNSNNINKNINNNDIIVVIIILIIIVKIILTIRIATIIVVILMSEVIIRTIIIVVIPKIIENNTTTPELKVKSDEKIKENNNNLSKIKAFKNSKNACNSKQNKEEENDSNRYIKTKAETQKEISSLKHFPTEKKDLNLNNVNNKIYITSKNLKLNNDIWIIGGFEITFNEMSKELSEKEKKYSFDPNYMSNQSEINHNMRAILINWLIKVHLKYKFLPQTIYITVNIIDRYLSKVDTNKKKLQLVGITALIIACKYEERKYPKIIKFVKLSDGAYDKKDAIKMELEMLSVLEFDISFSIQWTWFEMYKLKLDLDETTFKLAWFLMELCLIDYDILKYKMNEIVASAILIASKTTKIYKHNWLKDNIGIDEKDLKECCKEIYVFYNYNATHYLQAIRKKFSSSEFRHVSEIIIC